MSAVCRDRSGCRAGCHSLRVAQRQAPAVRAPASPPTPSPVSPPPPRPPRKLIGIAFGDLNPFPLRQIRNRRALHLEKVRLELTELEAIREDFLRERDASPDKGALVSDEEDT